jgi:hypothetical protein
VSMALLDVPQNVHERGSPTAVAFDHIHDFSALRVGHGERVGKGQRAAWVVLAPYFTWKMQGYSGGSVGRTTTCVSGEIGPCTLPRALPCGLFRRSLNIHAFLESSCVGSVPGFCC